MKKILIISSIIYFAATKISAQTPRELIQFSGVVMTRDSTRSLPLVSVRIKASSKGSYSDHAGFFSFVAAKGDTIIFSSIGLKTVEYKIPKNLITIRFSIIQAMEDDTIFLPATVINPGPSLEEFNYYFVKATIPDYGYAMATNNTRRQALQNYSANMSIDSREAARYLIQDQNSRYYYNGQLAPNRIFDPFAWGQFFRAWKRGDFNKQ